MRTPEQLISIARAMDYVGSKEPLKMTQSEFDKLIAHIRLIGDTGYVERGTRLAGVLVVVVPDWELTT